MLVAKKFNKVGSRETYIGEFKALKIEGADELAVLCPVSKLTGFPMSMQEAILMISDKNSRLVDVLFQEIPAIRADENISDTDKLKMLVSRLDSGSFYENDKVAEILGNIAKEFFPEADVDKVQQEASSKINFNSTDAPSQDS